MQLLYVLIQLYLIYMFITGRVCEPATQEKVPTVDLPPGMPRGMMQYCKRIRDWILLTLFLNVLVSLTGLDDRMKSHSRGSANT